MKPAMQALRRLLLSLGFCVASGSAYPLVTYDTLGSGNAYQPDRGWTVGGPTATHVYMTADRFTASQTGALSTVTLPLFMPYPALAQSFVELFADSAGVPGAVLASATIAFPSTSGQWSGLVDVTFTDSYQLLSGSTYWVGVGSSDFEGVGIWYFNANGFATTHDASRAPTPAIWSSQVDASGAIRIEVSPVPEPGSAGLVFAGLLAVLVHRRRGWLS
jgi:hypothetical protein